MLLFSDIDTSNYSEKMSPHGNQGDIDDERAAKDTIACHRIFAYGKQTLSVSLIFKK